MLALAIHFPGCWGYKKPGKLLLLYELESKKLFLFFLPNKSNAIPNSITTDSYPSEERQSLGQRLKAEEVSFSTASVNTVLATRKLEQLP